MTLTLRFRTLHFTLHVWPSQLCPFRTWRCMEPWPCSIFMLRAHLPVVVNCRLALHARASKGPLRCRRWTFEFSRLSCHDLVYACLCWMSSFASCNSRQQSYVLKNCAYTCATFCVSCPSPCQASFRPLPVALKCKSLSSGVLGPCLRTVIGRSLVFCSRSRLLFQSEFFWFVATMRMLSWTVLWL